MTKMKIAFLTSWQTACGIAEYSAALVQALRNLVEVTVVPLEHGRTEKSYFRALGRACNQADLIHAQHEYVFFGGRDPWSYRWPQLVSAFRAPYVVTAHTWLQPFSGGPRWKRWGRSLRDGLYRAVGWERYLVAGQFRRARAVIVHTSEHRAALLRRGLNAERVHVLPQGVPALPAGDAVAARARWNLSGQVVLMFGFLNADKGHRLALEAWRLAGVQGTLVIAGKAFSAAEELYARSLAAAVTGFGPNVRLVGFLPEAELADLLAAAEVVLLPYRAATSSYALSLALAQGRPVLASDLPPFREILAQNACLELFRRDDVQDLAQRLRGLLWDDRHRADLSLAARVWAQAHAWGAVARETVGLYAAALGK
jgi:glycosyltransferase involved in cell wall biosynthesis